MPVLSRYDATSDAVVNPGLGRYDVSSSESDSQYLSCKSRMAAAGVHYSETHT